MSQGPGPTAYAPYTYPGAPQPRQGYYAPSHAQQPYPPSHVGGLPPGQPGPSSYAPPPPHAYAQPPPQHQGYPQQQAPAPPAGYGYAPLPSVGPPAQQPYYGQPGQMGQPAGAPYQQPYPPGVPHPQQVQQQYYHQPAPPVTAQGPYAPPPTQGWYQQPPSAGQPAYGHPPPPHPSSASPYGPPPIQTSSPYVAHPQTVGGAPSPSALSSSVRYSASNPPRSSYAVSPAGVLPPPVALAQPQPERLSSPLPVLPPVAPPAGKYQAQIPSALSPLPSATISPLNRGPPSSSPAHSTAPLARPPPSTTSSFSSTSSSIPSASGSSRPLPPPQSSAATRRFPPIAPGGVRPGSSYDGINSPTSASSPLISSRPPLPTPGGSSTSASGRPLPSPAPRDRSDSSPKPMSGHPLPTSSSSSSTDLNRSDTLSSVKSLDRNGGRPLPRPPGGVANSKSLDRGVGERSPGSRPGDLSTADPSKGAGGIARAATLPSGSPQPAAAAPTRRGSNLPTLPSLPQPPRTTPVMIPTSPSAPLPAIVIPTISTPSSPPRQIPTITTPTAGPSTPTRSDPPPPSIIVRTSPSPSHKVPVISEPTGAPPPFIVPIFNFPDGDEDDDDKGPHQRPSDGSEGGPSVQISFSASPKAQPKPLPPAVPTTSEASTIKKRGAGGVVCEGCGEVILGKLIGGSTGMVWHPKCYKCTTCGLQLEHVSPYEHDGKLYCHFDYHELFTTRCYTCKTPIVDERFFTVLSPSAPQLPRYYHELHFFCSECGDPFLDPLQSTAAGGHGRSGSGEGEDGEEEELGMGIHWWKDHPFCQKCDVKLHNPKCTKCKEALEGEFLEALGGKWHAECLVCDSCEKEFENGRIFQWEDVPLCEPCFELIRRVE